jgi:hypothetical protein
MVAVLMMSPEVLPATLALILQYAGLRTKDTLHDVRLRRLLSWLKADVKIALSVI